ncbi:F-box-like domain-containing protein [Pochonia chlamydosporia 170]|uniref:F-box-like domain-containing protein n=1 Tax=Pochonia chlamydosporia 170 TaxID=1380566 RepID=A0A179F784_METCM|nr:F-box-like domain-containing protein [Pochonia chlamydosporia 170]OAQ61170.1 F-box-like domain-containing protein [Pochonia chlamydosporia 170]
MTQLIDLPLETLHHIAWQLSSRYRESAQDVQQEFQDGLTFARHSEKLTALSRLSRTCRHLRDIVQPILFHSVFDTEQTCVSLITTLNKRPDLANAVAELQVQGKGVSDDCDPATTEPSKEQSMLIELLSRHFQTETQQPPSLNGDESTTKVNPYAALLIALTPNVKRLHVEVGYWGLPTYQPGSLRCLKELSLAHQDTELGFDLADFYGVVQAAPALETLGCHMIANVSSTLVHENLTSLQIQYSCLTNENLQRLVTELPKLERFSYSSAGAVVNDEPEATPREIFEAIRLRSSTLKHLHVDLQLAVYMEEPGERDIIPSLACMQALQTLEISALALAVDGEATDGNVLTNALPSSIRSFTLLDPHGCMTEDISRLAEAERFPLLKEVSFYHPSNQPLEIATEPFVSRGIRCSNKGPFSW